MTTSNQAVKVTEKHREVARMLFSNEHLSASSNPGVVIEETAELLAGEFPDTGWISVEDQLPDLGVTVQVTGEGWVGTDHRFQHPEETRNWWRNSEGEVVITHWQPLPQPPKESKE